MNKEAILKHTTSYENNLLERLKDAELAQSYLEAAFVNRGSLNIQPYASLQFIRQQWDSYTETGAGALNLKVADSTNNSFWEKYNNQNKKNTKI